MFYYDFVQKVPVSTFFPLLVVVNLFFVPSIPCSYARDFERMFSIDVVLGMFSTGPLSLSLVFSMFSRRPRCEPLLLST